MSSSPEATSDYDFDSAVDRAGTSSYKWDRYAGRDVIPLWVADMDFRSPLPVIEALRRRVDHGIFGYGQAPTELEAAVQDMLRREYEWDVRPDWIIWLPGLVSGLNVVCRSVGERGDDIATFTPIYPPFLSAPLLAERGLVKVPLRWEAGRWDMDLELLESSLTPQTRLLLLCSPHNPVGRAWSARELGALAHIVREHDLIVGSDDIHAGLILEKDRRHIPFACLEPDLAARTITLMAPSKTFNIPGLGCSFAIISEPRLRRAFCRAMDGIVPHVNVFGYVAAEAAYREGEPWRQALLTYLRGNRDLVEGAVAQMPGLRIAHVEATYLAWIDARGTGLDDPAGFFENAGVGLSDGCEFDAPGFVRLNFGCARTLLREALERMGCALSRLPGSLRPQS